MMLKTDDSISIHNGLNKHERRRTQVNVVSVNAIPVVTFTNSSTNKSVPRTVTKWAKASA